MKDLIERVRAMQLRGNTPPYEMAHLKDDIIVALTKLEAEVARLESPVRAARVKAESELTSVKASVAYLAMKKRAEAAEAEVGRLNEAVLTEQKETLSAKALEQTLVATDRENVDLRVALTNAEDEVARLQALHLERTKLTTRVIEERQAAEAEVGRLKAAIREHRDSFNKDMDEHDWTTEDEALWSLVEEKQDG